MASTSANACETDTVRSVNDDGEIVILNNDHVWEIDGIDRIDTALWLPAEDVLECSDYLINTDSNGEKAGGHRLR